MSSQVHMLPNEKSFERFGVFHSGKSNWRWRLSLSLKKPPNSIKEIQRSSAFKRKVSNSLLITPSLLRKTTVSRPGVEQIENGYLKMSEKDWITWISTRKYDKIATEYKRYTNRDRRVWFPSVANQSYIKSTW